MNTLVRCFFASPLLYVYDSYLSCFEFSAGDHAALGERLRESTSLPRMPDIIPVPDSAILPRVLFQRHILGQSQ